MYKCLDRFHSDLFRILNSVSCLRPRRVCTPLACWACHKFMVGDTYTLFCPLCWKNQPCREPIAALIMTVDKFEHLVSASVRRQPLRVIPTHGRIPARSVLCYSCHFSWYVFLLRHGLHHNRKHVSALRCVAEVTVMLKSLAGFFFAGLFPILFFFFPFGQTGYLDPHVFRLCSAEVLGANIVELLFTSVYTFLCVYHMSSGISSCQPWFRTHAHSYRYGTCSPIWLWLFVIRFKDCHIRTWFLEFGLPMAANVRSLLPWQFVLNIFALVWLSPGVW